MDATEEGPTIPKFIKSGWVQCPICGMPSTREESEAGDALIHCVNHACASNGGSNSETLVMSRAEEEAIVEFRIRYDGYMRKITIGTGIVCVLSALVAWVVSLFW